ncbi:MAG: DUF402 domain-containing protein [Chloroflexi bacterium]|nr:DUF402 domain-containing protein [Chloroflexota bacterium]
MSDPEKPAVMIRGIYATALTRLLATEGFLVVQPSSAIAARFDIRRSFYPEEVRLEDREDGQAIILSGEKEAVRGVVTALRQRMPDVIVRTPYRSQALPYTSLGSGAEVEFPADAKGTLDEIRNETLPTLPGHHRFRSIDSDRLDAAEEELRARPEARDQIAHRLRDELIHSGYVRGNLLRIEHVKVDGKVFWLSEGDIVNFDKAQLLLALKRTRFRGRSLYDGLRIPKAEGDYAMTEAREGAWVLKHSYFTRQGVLKGEYFNINTSIEFYPDRIRYVDLEVDVVRWPNGKMEIVDVAALRKAVESGRVTAELAAKAMSIASELVGEA